MMTESVFTSYGPEAMEVVGRYGRVLLIIVILGAALALWTAARRWLPGVRLETPPRPAERGGRMRGPDYAPLEAELRELIATYDATYGICFRDLESGAGFGINEREPITAASTVKVPVVLYLNTLVARGRAKWSDRVAYDAALDYQDGAGVLQFTAKDGATYSLRILANLAITVSDNIAYRMILRHLGKDNVAAFMRGLGGEVVFPDGWNVSCARDMVLYVQAVLDFARAHPDLGQRLLDDMAHSIYHVGLPGLLPPDLTVAHKEGDVTGIANDVGVVLGSRPYILAVLSRGVSDIDEGFARIAEISRVVYDYQSSIRSIRP